VVPIPNHAAVYQLPHWLDTRNVSDSRVSIVANDEELARLRLLGYSPRVTIDDYRAYLDSVLLAYRTYAQVCSTMVALASQYPSICRLETLGFSVQNRAILMMLVSDNPLIEEAEPAFRILGPHHGNEKIATEITLSFLQYVLASYDTNMAIRRMVDSTELWVVPIVNVDGFVLNQRENYNGVDINRDYGYRWDGDGGSTAPFSQPEPRLVRQHSLDNNIAIEFAYHSDAAYVNYLWDNHPADPPDSNFIVALATEYMDSTYGSSTTQLDTINGYRWYEADGTCQDAGFGLFGNIAYTIETALPSQQAKIDSICVANRRALLAMIRAARRGISGVVRDSLTGAPLFARITIDSPKRWDCYTDADLGDFHKPLPAGVYTLTAHAQGYAPKKLAGIIVPSGGTATADFDLMPDTAGQVYVEEMVWMNRGDPDTIMGTMSIYALGSPDDSSFSLGRRGDVCLSAGRGPAVANLPGYDITVFDSDSIADGYWLYAGDNWAGPWTSLGHANGTREFDLGSAGLDSARYLRIVCDTTASRNDPKAGLDLDAVAYSILRTPLPRPSPPAPHPSLVIFPNPTNRVLHITLPPASGCVKIIDIAGRAVKCYPFPGGLHPDGDCPRSIDVAGLEPGVYFARLENEAGTSQLKFVVARTRDATQFR